MRLLAAVLTAALAATGCSGSYASRSTGDGPTLKIGIAYDIGGRGDQSVNDLAAAGLTKAKEKFRIHVTESAASSGESDSSKEQRLLALVASGHRVIIAVGSAYSRPLTTAANHFPDVRFAIIDDATARGFNITNLLFAENQGSFLVGAAAAMKSKTGNIGFVGEADTPLIHKLRTGYEAGAKAVNPGVTIQVTYLTQPPDVGGLRDSAKGRTAAAGMFAAGADVVYCAAGRSAMGVFQAAKSAGKLGIGVGSDQHQKADPSVRDAILTSMLKKVDVALYDFVQQVVQYRFVSGVVIYDLKRGGVGYATSGGQTDDITQQLETYQGKIISGEIMVPEE